MRFSCPILALAALLAACGSRGDDSEPQGSGAETRSSPTPTGFARPDLRPGTPLGFTSDYTDFDLSICDLIRENREEGSGAEYKCTGRMMLPIFVQEGDGRFDLDAYRDNDRFETIGAFNEIGDRLEWRKLDDRPIAVIFRYRDVTPESGGRTVLAVERIGRAEDDPGCRVAQVSGNTPNANIRARQIADAKAANFDCGSDETVIVGDAR